MFNQHIFKNNNKTSIANIIIAISLLIVFLFSCKKKEEGKLNVTTKTVTEITTNSAKSGGNVTSTGEYSGLEMCGVCWSKNPSPTTNDFFTTDNMGFGEFTALMKNLDPETKYYVRAYAKTKLGVMYGEELDFTTEALPVATVTVYTNDVTEITASTARCGGVVTSNGSVIVATRGVCWSTSPSLSIENSHTIDGQGLGAFSSIMTQLAENTTYYVKAYATTESGVTYYGEEKSFTTESNGGGGGNNEVTVYTSDVSEITTSTAKSGGRVSCNGTCMIIARGLCWNTTHNPEVSGAHTADGQGTGAFVSNLTGLSPNTTYFARAYAITNSEIIYGNEVSFNTLSENPSEIEVIEITYNSVKIRISPAPNVAYYTVKVIGMGNAVQHSITETELVFNNLSEHTQYTFEFSFYRSNGNLIDTDRISATTLEKPYEYAYVTVTAVDVQPGCLEIQFEPSPNTAYYCFNQGPNLTSSYQHTGVETKKYNYLQPDTEYVFSVVAYDNNGVAGEVIHPTFRTAPAPYSNYLRQGNTFYPAYTAQITTEVLANGWGQKVIIIRGETTKWIRLQYLCYSNELNNVWDSGTYSLGGGTGTQGYHGYTCAYNLKWQGSFNEGTFTLMKSGNNITLDIASETELIWMHFSGTATQ